MNIQQIKPQEVKSMIIQGTEFHFMNPSKPHKINFVLSAGLINRGYFDLKVVEEEKDVFGLYGGEFLSIDHFSYINPLTHKEAHLISVWIKHCKEVALCV